MVINVASAHIAKFTNSPFCRDPVTAAVSLALRHGGCTLEDEAQQRIFDYVFA